MRTCSPVVSNWHSFHIINCTYVHRQWIDSKRSTAIEVNHQTTAASRTELVRNHFAPELVRAKMVVTRMKRDLLSFRVDEEVAIGVAYGTVAGYDFVLRQGRDMYDVSHGATVAVCLVRSELRSCEGRVRDRRDLGGLVFRLYFLPISVADI